MAAQRKYTCPKRYESMCDRHLNDDYKFFWSFENSICREYVTEKLGKIHQLDVVPIVLGNTSYSDLLPPHSYIDEHDFASPRHLADYLKLLDANDTLCNEYVRWREKYVCGGVSTKTTNRRWCHVCRHALAMRGKKEIVKDLVAEWDREQHCSNPNNSIRAWEHIWAIASGEWNTTASGGF